MELSGGSAHGGATALPMPDVLLDADRLHMLLDLVCADYITASYASRENGKRVLVKALEKLQLSVHAAAGAPVSLSSVRQDPVFADRVRAFYDDVMHAFAAKRLEHQQLAHSTASNGTNSFVPPPPSPRVMEDALVREVLQPKLLLVVDEMCKERDQQLAAANGSSSASTASGSTRSLLTGGSSAGATTTHSTSATHTNAPNVPAPQMLSGAMPTTASEIRMEGWLRKKGQHVTLWRERYFMIRSTPNGAHYLCYFRKKGEKEPRGWYVLGPGTTVDEVRESPSKIETKKLFTFRIRHLAHATSEDVEDATAASAADGSTMTLPPAFTPSRASSQDFPSSPDAASATTMTEFDNDHRPSAKKANSTRRFRSRAAAAAAAATAATAVVLTGGLAGVGIGMGMGMSAAAAASAGAAGAMMAQNRSKGPIALAAESLETAVWWRNSILECIAQAEEQWKRYLNWYMDKDHDQLEADPSSTRTVDDAFESHQHAATPGHTPPFLSHAGQALSASSLTSSTRPRSGSFGTVPRSIAKTFRTSATFSQETSWKLYDFSSKLRVDVERTLYHSSRQTGASAAPPPALRTSMKVMASPRKVFEMLMKPDSSFYRSNHVIQEAKILEAHVEDHSDVVYWKLAPTFLWPVQVATRDLCLLRYWRKEQDSSYFICFQSTTHSKCPPTDSASVRASVMGGGFIISPRVHAEESFEECWVTLTIQMNPKGWIDAPLARSWYYMHAYGVYFLEMITAIVSSTAVKAHDQQPEQSPRRRIGSSDASNSNSSAVGYPASTVSTSAPSSQLIVSETAFPILEPFRTDLAVEHGLPTKFWSEPSATSFFVRSAQFLSTNAKVPSAHQLLRLVNVELYRSSEPVEHIGLSSFAGLEPASDSGAAGSLARLNDQTPILVINFMIPGPPHHSLVLYFTPEDTAKLAANAPFADLFHQFFYGADDDFRSKRLKLIPRVVQGTWPIREGVGTTPAILGTKTYQKYFRGPQYLEVDYDIGSSTVAASVAKLLLGYSRDLIIDLAFVIEGKTRLELPERVLGCVRLDCIDLRHAVPFKSAAAAGVAKE